MTAGGVWVLVGLVAIALASPWAAVVVGAMLTFVWWSGATQKPSNQSPENRADTGAENQEWLEENAPK